MAALLLAGWIIFPPLAVGEAGKGDHSAGAGHPSSSQKSGKGKNSSAGKGQGGKITGDGSAVSPPEAGGEDDSAGKSKTAPGSAEHSREHSISSEDAEESGDHAENASGDSSEAGTRGTASEEDERDGLAGIVPSREQANRSKMNALLPPGSTHRGVYYPSFFPVRPDPDVTDPITGLTMGVDAPLASLFRGEAVTRLDDNHVLIDKASFVQYDQASHSDAAKAPKQTLSVDLEEALYDLKNDILVSHRPVRIENEQMILTGDSMVHDRVSGLTELSGGVRMILFSDNAETNDSGGDAKADPAAAAADPVSEDNKAAAASAEEAKSDPFPPTSVASGASSNPPRTPQSVASKKSKSKAAEPSRKNK